MSRWLGVCLAVGAFLAAAPAVRAACGNGVVEAGEDCDDGSQNGSTNSCCGTDCKFNGNSPDVIVGMLYGSTSTGGALTAWGTSGGISAYSVGTKSCNVGSCWLNWISGTNEHPVIGENMYRLKGGRFEQIGQSWLKHGFTALTENLCGTCIHPPSGSHLGVSCSDPYSAGLNGDQSRLGPKWQVNPSTGVYAYPFANGSGSGALYKRLQIRNTDLDPSQNAGAVYFVEGQYVTHDDATAKNQNNNASYRRVTVTGASAPYTLTLQDSTVQQESGIKAWKDTDASVTETIVSAPDGLYILSAQATSLGGGVYHYEYALQNLNSDRAAGTFSVPIPAGTVVTNVGFHDVDYHSGEPFDGTDWPGTVGATSVSWATTPYATNQNANALRWGTLYNFRFDASAPPNTGSVDIGLFKPGGVSSASGTTIVPGTCAGAANGALCNDNSACTQSDTCQSGACVGGNPVVCSASDQCHLAGTCNAATGLCSNPAKPNGSACNDGALCTQPDTCQSGACTGTPVVCTASDSCHTAGTCNGATGVCSNPVKANGSACSDGNACTQTDTCQTGVCNGANPVLCTASDQCHTAGICNAATGVCSNPALPDGTECSDDNHCTRTDSCQSGACSGFDPVLCAASDQCHATGTCDVATGHCSNPALPDGTACDDANSCSVNDVCTGGACAGTGPPTPAEVDSVSVSKGGGTTTISWSPTLGAVQYDVLRGLVSALPVGPGGGDETCLEDDLLAVSTTDAATPALGESFWYLVYGENPCGKGSYGYQRSTTTCP